MTGRSIKKTPKIMHHSKANCRGAFPHLRLVVVTRGCIGSHTGTATIRDMILVEEEFLAQQPKREVPGVNTTTPVLFIFDSLWWYSLIETNWQPIDWIYLCRWPKTSTERESWRMENEFGRTHGELYPAHENWISWCYVRKISMPVS